MKPKQNPNKLHIGKKTIASLGIAEKSAILGGAAYPTHSTILPQTFIACTDFPVPGDPLTTSVL